MNSLLAVGLILIAGGAAADTADVSWTPATLREDGTALTAAEIAHHNVYLSDGNRGYTLLESVVGVNTVSIPLDATAKTAVVTTVDIAGRESVHSEIVNLPIGTALPNAPTAITITIQYGK